MNWTKGLLLIFLFFIQGYGVTSSVLDVSISVSYTSPSGFDRSAPYYRAASPLSLTCTVSNVIGPLFYSWTSNCTGNCFTLGQSTQTVSTRYLKSTDNGLHTCTVYGINGETGSTSVAVKVVGAGIYVVSGHTTLPNNGMIITSGRVSDLRCISGSTSSNVGHLFDINEVDITLSSTDPFFIFRNNPGTVHVRSLRSLRSNEQGIYTCRIPDESGTTVDVNVGLYLSGSAVAPTVSKMEYAASSEGTYKITCTSTGSPPTFVSWERNQVILTNSKRDEKYTFSKTVIDRATSTYDNVLTIKGNFADAVGDYTCNISNSLGLTTVEKTINALQISGHESPIIVGLSGTLQCSTILNITTIKWYKTGISTILESSDSSSVDLVLTPNSDALDGTSYTCQAVTVSGKVYNQTVTIEVKELNNIVTIFGPSTPTLAGSMYTLTCTVFADITPQLRWTGPSDNTVSEGEGIILHGPVVSGNKTTYSLTFSYLRTSQAGVYSCLSIIDTPTSVQSDVTAVTVKIPRPTMNIVSHPNNTQLFTTQQLNITCYTLLHPAVDTAVGVANTWSGPTGVMSSDGHVSVAAVAGKNLEFNSTLHFSSLRSSDSGTYSCFSKATHVSSYIVSSEMVSATIVITASLETLILIDYTPPDQYPDYAPPNYRAASSVTLRCSTEGAASGSVSYRWSSTCSSCFASSSTSASITENMLRSRDGGVHTCTATDSVGNTGNSSTTMSIVGAGIYVTRSVSYAGRQAAQPNDSYIVVDSGSHRWSDYIRLKLYCCSNATSSSVGSFTFPNRVTRTSNYGSFRITRFSTGNSYAGCIYMDIYYYKQTENCYYTYNSWFGYRQICNTVTDTNFVLENSLTGVYSCNIPDAWGTTQNVHFALYSEGSHSISITGLQQKTSTSAPSLSCLTSGVPPTEVSWQKNDQEMILNDDTTEMVKSITNRYSSSYSTSVSLYSDIETVIGNYTCKAGNRYGTSTSQTLIIKGIETNITSNSLVVGNNIEFNCSSDLDPQTITWYRDGSTVANASGSYKELYIDPVSTDDQGVTYSCTVISPYGSQERNETLSVTVPDNWATVSTSVRVPHRYQNPHHGDNYTIDCRVHIIDGMNVAPVIQWYYPNGSVVENGKRVTVGSLQTHSSGVKTTSLTFSPVESDDGGEYSCRAQVTVPWMTEQRRVHSASVNLVVRTKVKFQLKLGPLPHCSTWDLESTSYRSTAHHLQRSIKAAIEEAVQSRCDCDFYSSAITSGEFSCQTTTSDVVYRAVINGRSDLITANETLDYIDDWKRNEQTILHNLFRLRLSQDCPLRIDSFNEVECKASGEDNGSEVKCDKAGNSCVDGRRSDKKGLLLGSGACYKFEACDSDSGVVVSSGDGDFLKDGELVPK